MPVVIRSNPKKKMNENWKNKKVYTANVSEFFISLLHINSFVQLQRCVHLSAVRFFTGNISPCCHFCPLK